MQDSYGRTIDYLRISVTERCNLACFYCVPDTSLCHLEHRFVLSYEQITKIATVAVQNLGFSKIRITGGEPLVRRDIVKLIAMLRPLKGPGLLQELAMTTNGLLLAPLASDLHAAGLDSVNVSLDTMDPALYAAITRGGNLATVLNAVRAAIAVGLRVKINTVVLVPEDRARLGGVTQNIESVRAFAESLGALHQCIARYHLDQHKQDTETTDISRPPPCVRCNRLRLLADGILQPCLHADVSIPVHLDDSEGSLKRAIALKPAHGTVCTSKSLMQIGG